MRCPPKYIFVECIVIFFIILHLSDWGVSTTSFGQNQSSVRKDIWFRDMSQNSRSISRMGKNCSPDILTVTRTSSARAKRPIMTRLKNSWMHQKGISIVLRHGACECIEAITRMSIKTVNRNGYRRKDKQLYQSGGTRQLKKQEVRYISSVQTLRHYRYFTTDVKTGNAQHSSTIASVVPEELWRRSNFRNAVIYAPPNRAY
jgi:hypothetical protein